MNARHLVLIALTGACLVVFAPTSKDTEPASRAQIAEKQVAAQSPTVQKMKVVLPKAKPVLPPGLGLDGNDTLQPVSTRKVRRLIIDTESGSLKE